jgi:sulfur-oxidizing protein SoxA
MYAALSVGGGILLRQILGAGYLALLLFALWGAQAWAQTEVLRSTAPADAANPLKKLIPGEEFLTPALRAQQADDFDNPAFPLVEQGEQLWSAAEGTAAKSCQACHGGSQTQNTIKRAAASFPKFDASAGQVITLSKRINICRQQNLRAAPWADDSTELSAMVAYLRWLSRGSPATVDVKGPNAADFERGAKLFQTKLGLLQLSCAQCHNDNYGHKFGAEVISQGHPLAYPVFKTSEGRVISLHDRIRMCNALVRAEGGPENSPDYVALELYLTWRSKNLPVSAPGVRP